MKEKLTSADINTIRGTIYSLIEVLYQTRRELIELKKEKDWESKIELERSFELDSLNNINKLYEE